MKWKHIKNPLWHVKNTSKKEIYSSKKDRKNTDKLLSNETQDFEQTKLKSSRSEEMLKIRVQLNL